MSYEQKPGEPDDEPPKLPDVSHLIDVLPATSEGTGAMYGVMGHWCSDPEEARDRAERWSQ